MSSYPQQVVNLAAAILFYLAIFCYFVKVKCSAMLSGPIQETGRMKSNLIRLI